MATKVEIIYEAEATSLKATVNEVTKANDAVVTSAQQSSKEVAKAYKNAGKSISAAFSGGEVKKALEDQNKAFEQLNSKGKSLTGQLRELKNQINQLEIAGEDGTDAFNQLVFAAAKLEDQIGDTRERVRVLASDTFKFDAAVGATQALAAGFEVAQGAAALFGVESEDLQQVIAKTTAVTAIANGVNELANQITGQGPLKLALYAAGQKAVAVATAISTGAISAFRVALAATGIGLLITGIAILVDRLRAAADNQAAFNRSLELSKQAAEGSRKAIKDLQKQQLDLATRYKIASGQITQTEADKQKLIEETTKTVQDNIKKEQEAQQKNTEQLKRLSGELARVEAANAAAVKSTKETARIQDTKELKDQIATQESLLKASQFREQTLTIVSNQTISDINRTFDREEKAQRDDEAKKAADDRAQAAKEAAQRELELRNDARKRLEQLELESLSAQLDESEKVLSDANNKILQLEKEFIDSKFKTGSVEEKKLQDAIKSIKQDATKQVNDIEEKNRKDKAEKEKEAAEKLAAETLRIRVKGLDDEINTLKASEINEGTSLERRIKLIELDGKKRIAQAEGDAATIELINAETQQAIREENKKTADQQLDQAFEIAQAVASTLNSIIELQGIQAEKRIEAINAASEQEKLAIEQSATSEADKQLKLDALRVRTEQKVAAEKRKQAVADKAAAIFEATINAAAAAAKASGNPVQLAIAIAAGAAQIAIIAATPIPKFKKGGAVGGRSHEAGGTLIEAERGEYVVNKNSAGRHRTELDALNRSSAAFKKLIDERYVRPAILSYASKRKDGIIVNASLNSKNMERELKGLRKDINKQRTVVNINGLDTRYAWHQN